MKKEQVISDEVLDNIQSAINRNENWIAYNTSIYFIDKEDIFFFKTEHEAREFATNNISDFDQFNVFNASSIADVFKQIPYGENVFEQVRNDPDANPLYTKDGNAFTEQLIDHIEKEQFLNNLKTNIMNEQNFEHLKNNLKYMGFGENLNDALGQNLKEGKEAFQLNFSTEINKKCFEATLNFRKSDNSDMYFFNSYQASLERKNGEKHDQTFYLSKGKGVTAKEAYNLLEGRSVHKELSNKAGEPYKAWIQLDFDKKDNNNNNEVKQFHENYGYDLKAAVSKFGVAELGDAEKEKALMQSLQKGNIQSVTVEKDGSVHKMFIEANPQFKTVNLYDDQMKRVQKESLDLYKSFGQSQSTQKQEKQLEVSSEMKQENGQLKNGKEHKKNDNLLPKKRNSPKKGLSIS